MILHVRNHVKRFRKPAVALALIAVVFGIWRFVSSPHGYKPPQLTVVFVIDQFAAHYRHKIDPYLKYGLHDLFTQGVSYEHATYPHGIPSTATGHASISTGAYTKHHGIVGNTWIDDQGLVVTSVSDDPKVSGVFKQDGSTYEKWGVSARNMMTDCLSDSFALTGKSPANNRMVFAFSTKDRSASLLGGRMGKAFWIDDDTCQLTTSKAYFDALPGWLIDFNARHLPAAPQTQTPHTWEPAYPLSSPAYNFTQANNYKHCALHQLCSKSFMFDLSNKKTILLYIKTPQSNTIVLDAAKECLKKNFTGKKDSQCLLWISLGSLDLAGHYWGPHSYEALDTIYHMDKQIGDFMQAVRKMYPNINPLFALTADHGVMAIPEVLNDDGYPLPTRIDSEQLRTAMNDVAKKEFGIEELVSMVQEPQFFFNKPVFRALDSDKQRAVTNRLADFLRQQPKIRRVWTCYDFQQPPTESDFYTNLFYDMHCKERSGELTVLLPPYHQLTRHPMGTSHVSPYTYDVHVPLVIWQKGVIEKRSITKPVNVLQLTTTLAKLLGVQFPSAHENEPLPCISVIN